MYPVKIQILYALLAVKGLLILKQFNSYMVITYIVKEQNFQNTKLFYQNKIRYCLIDIYFSHI